METATDQTEEAIGLRVDSHYAATVAYDRKDYWFNAGNKTVNKQSYGDIFVCAYRIFATFFITFFGYFFICLLTYILLIFCFKEIEQFDRWIASIKNN